MTLLSITEAAKRLRVSPDYIHQLVTKGRLTLVEGDKLAADDVDRLAQLMEKLRDEGIATLVKIAAQSDKDL